MNKSFLIKSVIINLGLFISGLGTALLYSSKLGSSAMAVFSEGIHNILKISYGSANFIANFSLICILFIIYKTKYIQAAALYCTFFVGVYINIGYSMFSLLYISHQHILIRFIVCLSGIALSGIGLSIYVAINMGLGPLEAIVDIIQKKTNKPYGLCKSVFDFLLTAAGVILGGTFGIGNILSIFILGYIMQFFIDKFKILFKKYKIIEAV